MHKLSSVGHCRPAKGALWAVTNKIKKVLVFTSRVYPCMNFLFYFLKQSYGQSRNVNCIKITSFP